MPSVITHALFAKKVYEKLNVKNASLPHLQVFAQSHDLLYYYHGLNKKKTKEIEKFGNYAHKSNTQMYLINIIRNMKQFHLENDEISIAYLYGSICHYVLDSLMHPYIFYKTGCYSKDSSHQKYYGLHTEIETQLDVYFYEKLQEKPIKHLKMSEEIIPKIAVPSQTISLIEKTYLSTYNKENISYYYLKGITYTRNLPRFLRKDTMGFKKCIYSLISRIINHNPTPYAAYSYYVKNIKPTYLNLDHKPWYHPCTEEEFTYSIDDLFALALEKTLSIIQNVNEVLYENKDYKDLVKVIPNLSYSTGLPIEENKPFIRFEF